jgi:hypothetical protein
MIDRDVEEYHRRMSIVYNDVSEISIISNFNFSCNDVIGMSDSHNNVKDCSFPFWEKNEVFFEEKRFVDPNIDFIIAEFFNSIG